MSLINSPFYLFYFTIASEYRYLNVFELITFLITKSSSKYNILAKKGGNMIYDSLGVSKIMFLYMYLKAVWKNYHCRFYRDFYGIISKPYSITRKLIPMI
ncbi:hypothetical protein BpHYR1_045659 [Brachionus plicatilis]|uniref:Uncharacterized protein n=1 Tax=Brachionus plicatilis TaxID=10195 RepID=A0A3M7PIT1_BRAPC|nr:hypothetical protein BpHYR1_045659 [Brachionus plicatilis]